MRITAIEIENFKGISERVRVDLKPITLLFGANSAGKSTILHALLYMKDVLERRNLDAITTPVSGRALDLGGFRNFVHGQDLNHTVRIAVHLELTGAELPTMASDYELDMWCSSPQSDEAQNELEQAQRQILESIHSASVEIEVRWDEADKSPVPFAYSVGLNGSDLIRVERARESLRFAKFDLSNPACSRAFTNEEMQGLRESDTRLRELLDSIAPGVSASLMPDQSDRCKNLLTVVLPKFHDDVDGLAGLENWLPKRQDPIPTFDYRETLNLPPVDWEHMDCWGPDDSNRECMETANSWAWNGTALLARLIIGPGKLLQEWLQGLRYIGPLRARPPRTGVPPDELRDWSEGLGAWKALEDESNSTDLIEQVSQWLAGKNRLNSGYELERKHLARVDADAFRNAVDGDLDRAQLLGLLKEAPKSTEIKLVEMRSGLRLDPSDVGVGISQVLPIVVGAVLPGGSVVAVEQPELHIHPAMQVALGDLFIEGAVQRGMSFLIETHSEHLILRLLRRIRETSDGELPPGLPEVKPEDISVLYVDKDGDGMRISSLPIDGSGEFTERWPRGFFVERGEELF